MSDDASARLGLPYLAAGQLQKHVTLNEVLTRLDALVQSGAVSRSTARPAGGARRRALYILPASPTGAVWASRASGELMRFEAGAWSAVPVPDGALIWVADEDIVAVRDGGGWVALGQRLGAVQGLTRLGLNTTADAANPFAAGSTRPCDRDQRRRRRRRRPAHDFQQGDGGRRRVPAVPERLWRPAELGLIGDDDLTLKVSADGATWRAALTVDRTTGAASFPTGCGRVETAVLSSGATWAVARLGAADRGGGGRRRGRRRLGRGRSLGRQPVRRRRRRGRRGLHGRLAVGDLAASLTVTVGGAGTAGASVSSGTGTTGGTGGISAIASGGVTLISAPGGGGGQGGGASSGTGGAGGAGFPASNGGGAGSVTATSGAGAALTRPDASGGGGAGGGLDAANTVRAGGAAGPAAA
jgi:hypothetical protein